MAGGARVGYWPLLAVALLALAAALAGALAPRSFLGRLRTLLALSGLAAIGAFTAELLASGSAWERWAAAILLGLVALTGARVVLLALFEFLLHRRLGVAVPRLTQDVVSAVVYAVVLLLAVHLATGADLRAFLATSAVLTLVLGLALQETLGTLFAGITLLGDKRLSAGAWIEVEGTLGQLEEITWRAVVLRTRLGQRLLVPNSAVARGSVRVWGRGEPGAVVVQLGSAYAADPLRVKAVLHRVARSIPEVLEDPSPQILLSAFGDSALLWECRLWSASPERKADIADAFLTRAWFALQREGVEIPFPQRVVHQAPPLAPAPQLEAVTRALAACPTFASLPEQLLHALARNSRLVTFAPGEIVVEEGEASEALYVIAAGRARVVRQGEGVATLGPGEHFGEIAFLTGQPRAASVVAQETLEAVEVDTQALRAALGEQPALAEELAQRVAARSAELSRRQELLEAASSQALKSTLLTRLRRLVGGN